MFKMLYSFELKHPKGCSKPLSLLVSNEIFCQKILRLWMRRDKKSNERMSGRILRAEGPRSPSISKFCNILAVLDIFNIFTPDAMTGGVARAMFSC